MLTLSNLNLAEAEKALCLGALQEGGTQAKAAFLLGISRHALSRRLSKFERPPSEAKKSCYPPNPMPLQDSQILQQIREGVLRHAKHAPWDQRLRFQILWALDVVRELGGSLSGLATAIGLHKQFIHLWNSHEPLRRKAKEDPRAEFFRELLRKELSSLAFLPKKEPKLELPKPEAPKPEAPKPEPAPSSTSATINPIEILGIEDVLEDGSLVVRGVVRKGHPMYVPLLRGRLVMQKGAQIHDAQK